MSFTYDPTDLNTSTSSGKLNSVRLLIGDTDSSDPLLQDEEILFSLAQKSTVYGAAALSCKFIVANFSRLVDTQLDGALQENYSDLVKNYSSISSKMADLDDSESGTKLGISAGGISLTGMTLVQALPDRPRSEFWVGQFDNPEASYDNSSDSEGYHGI